MDFFELAVFKKEFKKYKKKYKSLDQDLDKFKKILEKFPCGNGSKNWNILNKKEKIYILKVRLSCAYLRKNSFRLVYAYLENENKIEFLEIFFKSNKPRENGERIANYLKKCE